MPKVQPSRSKAHLTVAAIRLLAYRESRPPGPEEIAHVLGWGDAETLVILRQLVDAGILLMHETPFEVRFEIADHRLVDELPEGTEEGELRQEVERFQRQTQTRQEEMERMFQSGETEQRRKQEIADLAKQFAEFRKKKPRPPI